MNEQTKGGRIINMRISNQGGEVVKSRSLGIDFLGLTTVGLDVQYWTSLYLNLLFCKVG